VAELINAQTPLAEARVILSQNYDLRYSRAVEKISARLYERLRSRIAPDAWAVHAPLILQINRLKRKQDAAILVHDYQPPQIRFGVGDATGDALALAEAAAGMKQRRILIAGVGYVAETVKLLNPKKTVLLPDTRAGCSVAASITPEDIVALRANYPGAAVVATISTSTAVKAASDAVCTAANALQVVEALPGDRVILVPDQYLARAVARRTSKKIVTWAGSCEVHEGFAPSDIAELRAAAPDARVLAHPGCPPAVADMADFVGDAAAMTGFVRKERPGRVALLTERSVSDTLAVEMGGVEVLAAGGRCSHMARITLEGILWSLHTLTEEVRIDPFVEAGARAAFRKMAALAAGYAAPTGEARIRAR
jgi:quinolinate synthase